MGIRRLEDLDTEGKRALVRVDLNLPLDASGEVTDDTRIQAILPTIQYLRERRARVILISHFGRPGGKPDAAMSLAPVVEPLSDILGTAVAFAADCTGPDAASVVDVLDPGGVAVLENTRFHSGEEANADDFVAALAASGDVYVNDAFSCAHRSHASTEGLAHALPAAAGRAMEAELAALGSVLSDPERPVTAIVGGSKVSSKLELLDNIVTRVDNLIIGGAMANTFLRTLGYDIGASLYERDLLEIAEVMLSHARRADCEVILPVDALVAPELAEGVAWQEAPVDAIPEGHMILDIGPASSAAMIDCVESSKTLVWNGPLGAFETAPFDRGTTAVAKRVAELTEKGELTSVAGGGDTVAALNHARVKSSFSYVSTAGGAFLEWLEGKELPGVRALESDQ